MNPTNSAQILRDMLTDGGLDFDRADPHLAWEVFKRFVQMPLVQAGITENLLAECGTYRFEGKEEFFLDFVRQYEYSDFEGEYDHMEQVHCTLKAPLTADLRDVSASLWSEEYPSLKVFFLAVEARPEFRAAIEHGPYTLSIEHEQL